MNGRLLIIRHVDTEWSERGILQGTHDPPLDESGLALLPRVAGIVAQARSDMDVSIVSSPLTRARQTAESIAEKLQVSEVTSAAELREVSFGIWEGRSASELNEDPETARAYREVDPHWTWPGADETLADRAAIACGFLGDMLRSSRPRDIVVVSHGLVIQGVLATWLFGDVTRARDIEIAAGSISVLRAHTGDRLVVEALGVRPDWL